MTVLNEFFAFDASLTAGLFVGTTDVNGDGLAEILVGTGPFRNRPPVAAIFNASGQTIESGTVVFKPHFRNGVHVAGSLLPFSLPESQEFGSESIQFAFDETTLDGLLNL